MFILTWTPFGLQLGMPRFDPCHFASLDKHPLKPSFRRIDLPSLPQAWTSCIFKFGCRFQALIPRKYIKINIITFIVSVHYYIVYITKAELLYPFI